VTTVLGAPFKVLTVDNSSNLQTDKRQHEADLAEFIIEYLAEHPQASDTLEGIAEWWIMRQQIRVEIKTLARVVRRLTNDGLLEKRGRGGRALYHLKTPRDAPPGPENELPDKRP